MRSNGLIEQNDRKPLAVTTFANPPNPKEFSKLLETQIDRVDVTLNPDQQRERDERIEWKKEDRTCEKPTYTVQKITPASNIDRISGIKLIRTLDVNNKWTSASLYWHCGLFTEGSVVKDTSTDEVFVVEQSRKYAVALWPLVQVDVNLFTKDPNLACPVWTCIFGLTNWRAVPIFLAPPLKLFMEDSTD